MNRIHLTLSPLDLKEYIDWNFLFVEWDLHGRIPSIFNDPKYGTEARTLYDDAQKMLFALENKCHILYAKVKAFGKDDDIIIREEDGSEYTLPQMRNQTTHFKCLADILEDESEIILFAITTKNLIHDPKDDYRQFMSAILCDRLADAMTTYLEKNIAKYPLTIAYGYPSAPDHSGKKRIYDLLQVDKYLDLSLTENYSMSPTSSIMGFVIQREGADYFNIGKIGRDQIEDYAKRAGLTPERLCELIPHNI